jgi:tRNA G18 (ribose-2'-O)-methylase SpoU
VAWQYQTDSIRAVREAVSAGYEPVALESGPGACSVDEAPWPDRICLVIGNEVAGIAPEVLDACRLRVGIPMRGVKDSLNVAVAFGIAGHRIAAALSTRERTCHPERDGG